MQAFFEIFLFFSPKISGLLLVLGGNVDIELLLIDEKDWNPVIGYHNFVLISKRSNKIDLNNKEK